MQLKNLVYRGKTKFFMNDDIAIKVENLSKYYRLGVINNGTLFRDIQSWWARVRGKEDPHAKIGSKYDPTAEGFWALKDLNFEIKKGERVGIIGHNGAGKSTLLKLLSQITSPTEGSIKINGKIASLLEVGTGFHPEMTGRENIYMNGAILGMTHEEIDKKVNDIIEFSEIGEHIDTPVKRYSSGMYVRLAFAVAAHLDSDILIADEVLAVGDAAFQKKALGKMNELSSGQGRTVLFVSHNMAQIKNLCNKGIVLEHGKIILKGKIDDCINYYLIDNNQSGTRWDSFNGIGNKNFKVKSFFVREKNSVIEAEFIDPNKEYEFVINYNIDEYTSNIMCWLKLTIGVDIQDIEFYNTQNEDVSFSKGNNNLIIPIKKGFFIPGLKYYITLGVALDDTEYIIKPANHEVTLNFEVKKYK